LNVIPAKAGIQSLSVTALRAAWIPACAGMTGLFHFLIWKWND